MVRCESRERGGQIVKKGDVLQDLHNNQHFRPFAEQKMAENGDFWRKESREGKGFMRDVAKAIVAVGGGDPGAP